MTRTQSSCKMGQYSAESCRFVPGSAVIPTSKVERGELGNTGPQ